MSHRKRSKCGAPSCPRYTSGAWRIWVCMTGDGPWEILDYCTKRHRDQAWRRIVP